MVQQGRQTGAKALMFPQVGQVKDFNACQRLFVSMKEILEELNRRIGDDIRVINEVTLVGDYVPYVGANKNVNLNTKQISAGIFTDNTLSIYGGSVYGGINADFSGTVWAGRLMAGGVKSLSSMIDLGGDTIVENFTAGEELAVIYQKTESIELDYKPYGQTFKAVFNHTITGVELPIYRSGNVTGTITVAIRSSSGNLPTSTVLRSQTIALSELSTDSGDWHLFEFSSLSLTGGNTYAIVVTVAGTGDGTVAWKALAGAEDYYTDGRAAIYDPAWRAFLIEDTIYTDFRFRIYTPAIPLRENFQAYGEDIYLGLSTSETKGQTFTAVGNHDITSIELRLGRYATWTPYPTVTVYLYETLNGLPTGEPLWSQAKVMSGWPVEQHGYWTLFEIETPIRLTAGNKYAITAKSSDGIQTFWVTSYEASLDRYTGGSAVWKTGGVWQVIPTPPRYYDRWFRIYGGLVTGDSDGGADGDGQAVNEYRRETVIISDSNPHAQVFTAQGSHDITSLDLPLSCTGSLEGVVNISVEAMVDGEPSGVSLGAVQVDIADIGQEAAWIRKDFKTAVSLTHAEQYAIVVDVAAEGLGVIYWQAGAGIEDPYGAGQALVNSGNWEPFAWEGADYTDFNFRVYGPVGPTEVTFDHTHVFSDEDLQAVYISDSGDNVLIAGDIEVQGDAFIIGDLDIDGTLTADTLTDGVLTIHGGDITGAGDISMSGVLRVGTAHRLLEVGEVFQIQKNEGTKRRLTGFIKESSDEKIAYCILYIDNWSALRRLFGCQVPDAVRRCGRNMDSRRQYNRRQRRAVVGWLRQGAYCLWVGRSWGSGILDLGG